MIYYAVLHNTWDKRSCHACKKSILRSKIKQFYNPRFEDSAQSTGMIDVFNVHSKSLKYTIGKLKEA